MAVTEALVIAAPIAAVPVKVVLVGVVALELPPPPQPITIELISNAPA